MLEDHCIVFVLKNLYLFDLSSSLQYSKEANAGTNIRTHVLGGVFTLMVAC